MEENVPTFAETSPLNDTAQNVADQWRTQDIIYLSIVGPVFLAAFVEWFLWLAAFCYCLIKAFRKADHWSTRVLAVIMILLFVALRGVFLPAAIVTLPLPPIITKYFPKLLTKYLQWFAFYAFAALLVVPWLFCTYQITVRTMGRKKLIKFALDENLAPKTVVVMPCYKEKPEALLAAVNSVVDCDYPASCIHVFLSFDGDDVDELYLTTADRLGIPVTIKEFPISIDVVYNGARVTLSRFPHGGKRHCQKLTYKLINKIYEKYLKRKDDLFILFIDSDCILDRVCIQNFMYEMELKPGARGRMLAMTGVITATTEKTSLITLLQDLEYVHGQLFERTVESGCGAVTCLPGALTILRFSAFRNMAKFYFADNVEHCEDLFDYGKCHLGEDRWLTHLFMVGAKKRYQIGMCTSAFCKTEAVQTMKSLLKQRRRWFLGFITNEVCMLTDWRLWRKYPLLCVIRFMQNTIRTTSLLFCIMVLAICTTTKKVTDLPVGFIAVSLGLNYIMMLYLGWKLKRFKAWLYPLMFLVNPFFNWAYMVYGIFSAGQRTWGGPRADAAKADKEKTPMQAVEEAREKGDELNVVPETFTAIEKEKENVKPAARSRATRATLLPSSSVEGVFDINFPELRSRMGRNSRSYAITHPDVGSQDAQDDCSDEDLEHEAGLVQTPRRLTDLLSEDGMSLRPNTARLPEPRELSRRISLLVSSGSVGGRADPECAGGAGLGITGPSASVVAGGERGMTPGRRSVLTGTTAASRTGALRPSPLGSEVVRPR